MVITSVYSSNCKVDKAVTNAILQSGVQVFSAWNIIDWTVIENDDAKLVIESIMIEKEGETKTLACDALFNFYEKTIDLNAFLGNEHRFSGARDIIRLIHFQLHKVVFEKSISKIQLLA